MRRSLLILLGFTLAAFVMAFPDPSRMATAIPGDNGDAMFSLWALRSGAHALSHGFAGFWQANIFAGHRNVTAWSESFLAIVPVFWALAKITGSTVLAFNLIYLSTWVTSAWASMRLADRFTHDRRASLVVALAYTYSAARLAQHTHFQLTLSALIPLALSLALDFLRQPTRRRGIGLGLIGFVLATSASYYSVLLFITLVVIGVGHLITQRATWRTTTRTIARNLWPGVAIAAILAAPVLVQQIRLQQNDYFHQSDQETLALHPGDLLAPAIQSRYMADAPILRDHASTARSENFQFPGLTVLIFGTIGLMVTAAEWRRGRAVRRIEDGVDRGAEDQVDGGFEPSREQGTAPRELMLVSVAALSAGLLAVGPSITRQFFGLTIPAPFEVARAVFPALQSLRALVRFMILPELTVCLFAGIGLAASLRAIDRRLQRPLVVTSIITSSLVLLVLAELSLHVSFTTVAHRDAQAAVNRTLATRPEGVVLELPISSQIEGWHWAFIEGPRMVLSTIDWQRRVNGYSGFQPENFDQTAGLLKTFPEARAFSVMDPLDVRYVILRTELAGEHPASQHDELSINDVGRYTDAEARARIERIPAARVKSVEQVGSAYLVELCPPSDLGCAVDPGARP